MTQAEQFKATPPPNLVGKKQSDTITRSQLVALVASRIPRKEDEDEADVRNRVRAMVNYHKLHTLRLIGENGRFTLGAVAAWARQSWPRLFDDLPHDHLIVVPTGTISIDGHAPATRRGLVLPDVIAECHAVIVQMDNTVVALEREVNGLRVRVTESEGEARRLAVKAAKYDNWLAKIGIAHKRKS